MAGLFIAHQIASTANVEIMARKLEPGTKAVEITQYLQTLFSGFGQYTIWFMREIGICAGLRTPDTTAQLI